MKKQLVRLWKETEAQDLTEYALLLSLVALAAIASMKALGGAINNLFSSAITNLSAAGPAQ
jgi:pilus assembly protein Flp/PilA